jgi:signal recognition particle GTPase
MTASTARPPRPDSFQDIILRLQTYWAAKGGVLVSLADRFGLPIHAIGVGEQIDDLAPFDPEEFAAALTGLSD